MLKHETQLTCLETLTLLIATLSLFPSLRPFVYVVPLCMNLFDLQSPARDLTVSLSCVKSCSPLSRVA